MPSTVMDYTVTAGIAMAYTLMANTVMAYIVMALCSYGAKKKGTFAPPPVIIASDLSTQSARPIEAAISEHADGERRRSPCASPRGC